MRHFLTALTSAVALTAAMTGGAKAGLMLLTDFTVDGGSLTSSPTDNLLTATSIGASQWVVGTPAPDPSLGGLAVGDIVMISNPISLTGTGTLTLSWDGGVYSDTLTITGKNVFGHTVDLVADGHLMGPGLDGNSTELDLSFTQSGGAGHEISGSASYTASSTVPEPSTWAMLGLGFASLGLLGWSKTRKPARYAF